MTRTRVSGRAASGPSSSASQVARVGIVDPGVEHRPAGVVLDQVYVDVIEPERQRETDRGMPGAISIGTARLGRRRIGVIVGIG